MLFFQFIKFGIVGLSNTFISYAMYATLTFLGIPYLLANVTGFLLSVLNAFFWNNRYVFRKSDDETRSLWWSLAKTFLSYAGTGLVLANILLVVFVEKFGISKYIAPILMLVITIPLNFLINKFWSFRTTSVKKGEKAQNEEN